MDQFKGKPRLPKFAVPKCYRVQLKPDLSSCRFEGLVTIDVDIHASTSFLALNAADISIINESVSFTSLKSNDMHRPVNVITWESDELLLLEFSERLPIGLGVLSIGYEGPLNDKMKGFYRSSYELNGEKKNMAVTQFEPADARRCFPCWDEPAVKAVFKITLVLPSELVALTNMPIIEEKLTGNMKIVSYQETPIMSTYLVAIVIGLFDYVEDHTSDGVKVRVYSQVGKSKQGNFALHVAVKTLELYKEYFGAPYALPKLDMVAIPDFAAGAMENYGLVTYRETALLYDDQHSAAVNKQRVASVVAHELAHQWFGNLVTMEWWTHLWLNEGFATWVSYLAVNNLFPEWGIWTQFLDETTEGLRLDGLEESHPIEVEVNHVSEIDEIFDSISYRKGASVIRMLQSYLGADCFQQSLASYIKLFAFANARTDDLWDVLEKESGEPVKNLMATWTRQKGYPVVYVKVANQKLELEQTQFLVSGSPGDGQWIVPVTLCYGSYDARKSFLLQEKFVSYDFGELLGPNSVKNKVTWLKINVDQAGFYRVKYDEYLSSQLKSAIEQKQLSETDRFGVLDDSFALCMACQQSLASLLSLMAAYANETKYTVLSNLINICYKIQRIVADANPELLSSFTHFVITILEPSAEKLGWDLKDGENHLDSMLRGEVLSALALFGHVPTLSEAKRRFQLFLEDRASPQLKPDIRRAAYVAVMQGVCRSNKSDFESLLQVYRETDLSQEKTRILGSLASCPDPDIVLDVLNFILSPEVRPQDAVIGLAVCKEGRETAWGWLQDNWCHISKTWGSGFLITRFVSAIVSPFASMEKAKEVESFFATRTNPSIARTLKQSIERVRINARWVSSVRAEKEVPQLLDQLIHAKK